MVNYLEVSKSGIKERRGFYDMKGTIELGENHP
jgi:hypothetical protein